MTWSFWVNIAVKILGAVLKLVSPEIKKLVEEQVLVLWKRALATENPWDDHFVELLASILSINLPPPE